MVTFLQSIGIDASQDKSLILKELKTKKNEYMYLLSQHMSPREQDRVYESLNKANYLIAAIEITLGIAPSFGPNATEESRQEFVKPNIENNGANKETVPPAYTEPVPVMQTYVQQAQVQEVPYAEIEANDKFESYLLPKWKIMKLWSGIAAIICSFFTTLMIGAESEITVGIIIYIILLAQLFVILKNVTIYQVIDRLRAKESSNYKKLDKSEKSIIINAAIWAAIPAVIYFVRGFLGVLMAVMHVAIIVVVSNILSKQLQDTLQEDSDDVIRVYKDIMSK